MLHIGIRFVMFVNMKVGLHLLSSFCLMLYSGTDCLTERPQKQKMGLCGKIQNGGPPPFGNALYAKKNYILQDLHQKLTIFVFAKKSLCLIKI